MKKNRRSAFPKPIYVACKIVPGISILVILAASGVRPRFRGQGAARHMWKSHGETKGLNCCTNHRQHYATGVWFGRTRLAPPCAQTLIQL
ncbi:hypothetical protein GDO78_004247 [Eleutherodactylus coqui]|uniref:Uncharacterized protein n=1 Tax=Eleutherodactylus coqui TaxID=57060 RepID=A0A8J6JZH4_ELECQ|nr:hypothetical protein GDO78_004247 [Eleutherodactylus coqui]